jgi:hypothetical protein
MSKLSKKMTLRQFDHGYWYATEIKRFAQSLGVPAAHRLRKDELEQALKDFTVREIPGQGHFANFFAPERLAAIILESIRT